MLHSDWLTENIIDLEYKGYLLLAYLKSVNESFSQSKLYPCFSELIGHQKNLLQLKNQKLQLAGLFPKKIIKINLAGPELEYQPLLRDDEMMNEINAIIDFSIPKIEHYIEEGNSIYNLVKENMNIFPVGVIPLYAKEGYFILTSVAGRNKKADAFQYSFSIFENSHDSYCRLNSHYVATFTHDFSHSLESIKTELIRNRPALPNPATFGIESELALPLNETLLPVAKKLLVKYVTSTLPSFKSGSE